MNWTTVHTVTYPSEAHVIKMQLENEGIEVFLKDELTIQTDNFISNAIGGVKIQVENKSVESALLFLKKLGYIGSEVEQESLLDTITKNIPIVKNWDALSKLFFVFISVFILLSFFVYFSAPNF